MWEILLLVICLPLIIALVLGVGKISAGVVLSFGFLLDSLCTKICNAYLARYLLTTLRTHHPELPILSIKLRRIGFDSLRIIQLTHSGGYSSQFTLRLPTKHRLAGATKAELYRSACKLHRLAPAAAAETS
ncbi:hypothetical protein [Pseudomonas sp. XWY-1]|uniref:hypothetical protein n=1 Tax=Pseudomonas sp. XWY-1 TaxID=2069256 RepID=UPI000CF4E9A2|nr:hypothetical protein [Pseudomonas sp. XWY-1]